MTVRFEDVIAWQKARVFINHGMSKDDKLRFYNYAQGSLEECRCYIYLSMDFNYISEEEANRMLVEIEETSKILNSYIIAIKNKQNWED